jgi:hypothetical protein
VPPGQEVAQRLIQQQLHLADALAKVDEAEVEGEARNVLGLGPRRGGGGEEEGGGRVRNGELRWGDGRVQVGIVPEGLLTF